MSFPENSIKKIIARYLTAYKLVRTDDEWLTFYSQLVDESRANDLDDLVFCFEGFQHWIRNEHEDAIRKFQQSISQNENLPFPRVGLGNVYRGQKDYEKAKEAYLKAIELDDKFAFPWNGLGTVYRDQKDYEKAKEAYLKAIELDDKFAYPWNGLGNTYRSQKDYEKAKEAYLKAIELDDKLKHSWNGLGNVYRGQKDNEKAQEAYLRAIELDDKNALPWYGLGSVYRGQKDYEKAEEAYLKAIELDDKNAHPWDGLGNVYRGQKDNEKAEEAYLKAIELDDKNAHPWNGLGNVYRNQKDYEKAKEAYLKAIELDDRYPYAYRNYGLLLTETNKLSEAKNYFKIAIDLFTLESNPYMASISKNNLKDVVEKIGIEEVIKRVRNTDPYEDPLSRLLSETSQFENEVFSNQKTFEAFVKGYAKRDDSEMYLEVLRRWNSYTPIVADNYHISKGGGYFLKIKGKGIVIDPGFNFIDNFKGAGHCFDEINAVMVSHAHNDHTSDLESILTLLSNCNKRRKGIDDFESDDTIRADIAKDRKCDIGDITIEQIEYAFLNGSPRRKTIDLFLTKSVDKKFGGMLNSSSKCDYKYHIVEKLDSKTLLDDLVVTVIGAKHDDLISDQESVGFIFDFDDTILIYTGDTGWDDEIQNQYSDIGDKFMKKHIVLLAHLGGFKEYENKYLNPAKREEAFYKQHLGRLGLGRLVSVVKPTVCFISEFGEELRLHRMELADIYNNIWGDTTFLPADIGLKYDLLNKEVLTISRLDVVNYECHSEFRPPKHVKTCLLRKDYSLHYFDGQAPFKESDLIQILIEQFDKSTRKM